MNKFAIAYFLPKKNGLPTNVDNELIPSEQFYLGRYLG